MNDWQKIAECDNPIAASMISSLLRSHGIDIVELNKRDSSYTVFGRIEIYCKPEDVIQAKRLLDQQKQDEH